jgi:predicted GIY-YIG superfamily endonuclease
MSDWHVYVICNNNNTYVGATPYPNRRLRQHNGEIKGGAKYTLSKGPGWKHICIISGFHTKIQALQFEWAVKHVKPINKGGIINRLRKLINVLNRNKWTSKSPNASEINLIMDWHMNIDFGDYQIPSYIAEIFHLE